MFYFTLEETLKHTDLPASKLRHFFFCQSKSTVTKSTTVCSMYSSCHPGHGCYMGHSGGVMALELPLILQLYCAFTAPAHLCLRACP